jgi:transcriptional regulator with XRE-family HTH domain
MCSIGAFTETATYRHGCIKRNFFRIPKARLSRYENGPVEPSIQTLNRLARALNVSEASLLGDRRAALEEFEKVLNEHGIKLISKEQARELAEKLVGSSKGLAKV